jgi:hypothetical protein
MEQVSFGGGEREGKIMDLLMVQNMRAVLREEK